MRIIKTTSDGYLSIENGKPVFLSDLDAVAQNIYQTLRLFQGEFFLDITKGIPYKQSIFKKSTPYQYISSIFEAAVLGVNGVISIEKFDYDYTAATREFKINDMRVKCQSGVIQAREVTI